MDWDFAIRRKRRELAAVLATLMAMAAAGAVGEGRCAVLRLLRPAESALRRLIFIMANRLKPASKRAAMARAMPDFSAFAASDPTRVSAFRLVDPRKRFDFSEADWMAVCRAEPRLWAFDGSGLLGRAQAQPMVVRDEDAVEQLDSDTLNRRIASFRSALDALPRQARRMARLIERRSGSAATQDAVPSGANAVGPLRPGLPPGVRQQDIRWASGKPYDPDDPAAIAIDCDLLARSVTAAPP